LQQSQENIQSLTDHLFRHEASKMIAVLTRIFGFQNLEMAEDVMQDAFAQALNTWAYKMPVNPSAWLMQTAKNKAIDIIRRKRYQQKFSDEANILLQSEYTAVPTLNRLFLENEIQDSQLRMIFACCHPDLSAEDQIALTLQTCSGFGINEIAGAFFQNYESIKKRIQRAKQKIVENKIQFDIPSGRDLQKRLENVLKVIYLIFNEGYKSSDRENLIRRDICEEAIRLCTLLTEHKETQVAETDALLALMYLLASRFDARVDKNGEIILLEDQDRNIWNRKLIDLGLECLSKSAFGDKISEYHLQAAIVAEHSLAKDFASTDWNRIYGFYQFLVNINPSPAILLNKAIVQAKVESPQNAVNQILNIPHFEKLVETQYLFAAALGELYVQLNDFTSAKAYFVRAESLAPTEAERKLLRKKLSLLEVKKS
jgi:RNA polymerase sigma factor (sigma-70 family)